MDGEVVVERRRQWSPEHKAALLAEVEAEGGQVSVVARRHGVSTSLLYNWRSAWKAAALAARATAVRPAEFVQLGVVADASGESSTVPMGVGAVARFQPFAGLAQQFFLLGRQAFEGGAIPRTRCCRR